MKSLAKTSSMFAIASVAVFGVLNITQGDNAERKFQPIMEAEMPEGFPSPSPLGEVEVKTYPAYRRAQSEMSEGGGFWTLFMHIKKHDIPMTAPVEIGYAATEDAGFREDAMSFLYLDPEEGTTGRDGLVQVEDIPEATVATIGVRGVRNDSTVDAAYETILKWLDENKEQYEIAGELRVMAYNSPFVPVKNRYYEVQIPIQKVETNDAE